MKLFSWQSLTGIGVGLMLAMVVMGLLPAGRHAWGPALEEHGPAMKEVVIQYTPGSGEILGVYCQFLPQLTDAVTVDVVCPDEAAYAALRAGIGPVRCRLRPILTGHLMTSWSRDRWVARAAGRRDLPVTLLAAKGEENDAIWPARAGDARIADDIATALAPHVAAVRSGLYFDGGDFLADGRFVFVTPGVIARNLGHCVATREELVAVVGRELGREAVLLEKAPDHHAGMFMMGAGQGIMLVADVGLGRRYLETTSPALLEKLGGGGDCSATTQERFDSVAQQVAALGYQVVRIPVIPSRRSKAYLTYVNVLIEGSAKAGGVVYLPVFRGAEAMNAAAQQVWESVGYRVRPVDCTDIFGFGGTLHCLVNVMRRE